ncbi:MAG: O-antigen ligase family protein [Clostridia bacterium]
MKNKKLVLPIIITLFLFVSFGWTTIGNTINYKILAMIFSIFGIFVIYKNKRDIKFLNPVLVSVTAYTVFSGISTLYANAGKFAISEYIKILVSFAIFIFVLVYVQKYKKNIKTILWLSVTLSFVTAILSIDGATVGLISPIIEKLIYGYNVSEYANWVGDRLTSIFGNSNVFASMLGINLLLSLYMFVKNEAFNIKILLSLYLMVQANAFLLAFSMGGTVSLSISVFAMILFAPKEIKYRILVIILEVLSFSFVVVLLTIGTYTSSTASGSYTPLLFIVLSIALFILCDKFVGVKVSCWLEKRYKQALLAISVFAFFVICFLLVALTTTESITLQSGENLYRIVYVEEGTYKLSINEYSDELTVLIRSQNKEEIILSEGTTIFYNSNLVENKHNNIVEIKDDVIQIIMQVNNNTEKSISIENITLTYEDGEIDVPLKYTLLPENIVSRIQGLRTNNSLITRLQYFQDSWKLFLQSPIIGHGLGGFENAIQSVQQYQYETKYAHNHFFQVMVDMGILGLLSYLFLLISCIIALIKSRKTSDLAPMLFGALMMIIVHGANEFSMSSGEFLPFAFAIFALIAVTCDVKIKKLEPYNDKILIGTIGAMSLFTIFLAGNIVANVNINSNAVTLDTLTTNASIDIYEKNDYKLSYVLATSGIDDATMIATSNKYLASLEKAKSNTISLYLAKYYVENFNPEKSYEQIVNYIEYSLYDPDTWNMAFNQYIGALQDASNVEHLYQYKDEYLEIINDLLVKLDETNEGSISQITLDDYSLMYVRNILASADIETAEEFLTYVDTVIYDSRYDTDANDNGTYDALISSSTNFDTKGNVTNFGDKIRIKVPYTYYALYKIEILSENVSKITIPTDEVAFAVTDEGKTVAFLDTTSSTDGYVDVIVNFDGDGAEFGGVLISR